MKQNWIILLGFCHDTAPLNAYFTLQYNLFLDKKRKTIITFQWMKYSLNYKQFILFCVAKIVFS